MGSFPSLCPYTKTVIENNTSFNQKASFYVTLNSKYFNLHYKKIIKYITYNVNLFFVIITFNHNYDSLAIIIRERKRRKIKQKCT